ncbi:RNA-binding protein [Paenibacillus sp. MBLB4367]|uniref:YlmH family RNA-binding protein n=1 Tax=Paenibacillus sp. MBLB4367 TaxID=3384767 RepID=UPI003907F410
MNKDIYAHFHPSEQHFVDKAAEWVDRASEQHVLKRTDFLDPRQCQILTMLANRSGEVAFRLEGGYDGAERKRAIIAPEYRNVEDEDAGILVLSVTSEDSKLQSLDHGDYMGAILSLGIKREKIGDILVLEDGGCQCLVAEEIGDYIRLQLQQVHRVHVQTELLPLDRLKNGNVSFEEMNISVASMRLDGIASDAFRLSRAKILIPIKAGRCRVNWKVEEDPSKPLKEGDVVSLQGFGRFRVTEVEGVTKKGRIRVKIGKYR